MSSIVAQQEREETAGASAPAPPDHPADPPAKASAEAPLKPPAEPPLETPLEPPRETPLEAPAVRMGLVAGLVKEARPKQWVKNVLVFTAPLASGTITHGSVIGHAAIAFAAFCLAASAIYYANDVLDVEADRRHPTKRNRPIAAGIIPPSLAWRVVALLSALALGVAVLDNTATVVVVAFYLMMHLSYSAWFKHVLVLDLAMVAGGFLLRAMAGGVASGIPLSPWFLLTTGFGALFMVAGKRYSELVLMGEKASGTRKSLAAYSADYLRFIWQTTAALAILTYSLWAVQLGAADRAVHWHEISIVPWAFVFMRYAMFVDAGKAGEPEDVVLGDRAIMAIGAVWLVLFALGVFA